MPHRNLEDYDVYAQYEDGSNPCIGYVELPEDAAWQDMPPEIEINGFTYKLEV